jgi:hypothetical protein
VVPGGTGGEGGGLSRPGVVMMSSLEGGLTDPVGEIATACSNTKWRKPC